MAPRKAARPTGRKTRKPRPAFSSGKSRSRQANPTDLAMQALAVYSGTVCLGHIMLRGKAGVEAYDRDDKSIGIYPDQKAAADAVSLAARGTI
jgi:hypothetical protein